LILDLSCPDLLLGLRETNLAYDHMGLQQVDGLFDLFHACFQFLVNLLIRDCLCHWVSPPFSTPFSIFAIRTFLWLPYPGNPLIPAFDALIKFNRVFQSSLFLHL